MNILVKFATRGRPDIFLTRMKEYVGAIADPAKVRFLVSYDFDDLSMQRREVHEYLASMGPLVRALPGYSKTKIEAINADINEVDWPWQILLVISDDMQLRLHHWDTEVRALMERYYPDTDGMIWMHDGTKQRVINTLPCIGRKYYEREGYVYHPSYSSFFCDNEATELAQQRGRIQFVERVLATHEHPAWNAGMKPDAIYAKNNRYWTGDRANYEKRKAAGWPK